MKVKLRLNLEGSSGQLLRYDVAEPPECRNLAPFWFSRADMDESAPRELDMEIKEE